MDGASAWFHVLTIFGKLLDGFYSPFLQEHGQHTYSQACQSIKWHNGPLRNIEPIRNNSPKNTQKEEKLSSHS